MKLSLDRGDLMRKWQRLHFDVIMYRHFKRPVRVAITAAGKATFFDDVQGDKPKVIQSPRG
jgi:hypothetical protein